MGQIVVKRGGKIKKNTKLRKILGKMFFLTGKLGKVLLAGGFFGAPDRKIKACLS
jgi:hypothetical protein